MRILASFRFVELRLREVAVRAMGASVRNAGLRAPLWSSEEPLLLLSVFWLGWRNGPYGPLLCREHVGGKDCRIGAVYH
jgi:hypothetical protein